MRFTSRFRVVAARTTLMVGCLFVTAATQCPNVNNPGTGFPRTAAWTQTTVNNMAGVGPSAIAAGDFDGDELIDFAVGYQGFEDAPPRVVIHFRQDDDTFSPATLIEGDNIFGVTALAIADMDGDERLDLVASATDRIVYFHAPADPRNAAAWTAFEIAQSNEDGIGQWNDVAVGDIDGANGPDIIACGQDVGRLSWFRSPAADIVNGTGWQRIDIDATTREGASSLSIGDVNGDGRIDIYSAAPGEEEARIAWYQNPTNPVTQAWTKFLIGNLPAVSRLAVGDLNADSTPDVIAINPPGGQIAWYVRPQNLTAAWTGFLISQFDVAFGVDVGITDVDGNNQPDVVVSSRVPGALRWFTPVGTITNEWTENNLVDLAETHDAGRFVLTDFDGDGRDDVVGCIIGQTADEDSIARWENPE